MHYERAVEQGTGETYDQKKAKEEEISTAEFTRGEYATLCRGNTSQVPVFSLLAMLFSFKELFSLKKRVQNFKTSRFEGFDF